MMKLIPDPSATSNEDQEENKEGHCSSSKPCAKFWGRETFWGDVSSEEWTKRYFSKKSVIPWCPNISIAKLDWNYHVNNRSPSLNPLFGLAREVCIFQSFPYRKFKFVFRAVLTHRKRILRAFEMFETKMSVNSFFY